MVSIPGPLPENSKTVVLDVLIEGSGLGFN